MAASKHKHGPAVRSCWAVFVTAIALVLLPAAAASAAAPAVHGTWAAEVTATSFRAYGLVDTGNITTTYHFDYIATSLYEANVEAGRSGFQGAARIPVGADAKVFAATTDQEVFQRIAGLRADTAYRYRLVVRNSDGEVVGPERAMRTEEASPDFGLAEGRGWEMVSPVDKNGGSIPPPEALFGGGDLQAADAGGSIVYGTASSFGEAAGAPGASQYEGTRNASGWSTRNVTLATEAAAFGPEADGVPFRIFSPDLSRALVLVRPHEFQLLAGPDLQPVASLATPDLRFAGASADLSYLVFSSCKALTPDAIEVPGGGGSCDPTFPNLYELGPSGTLQLVNLEPGQIQGTPGAELAAQSGAVSSDGARVYWTDDVGSLLLRDGARTLLVDPAGTFQIASVDGGIAYYTSGGHLYRYTVSTESSTDLTPLGGVVGVLGASAGGSYVYFLDGGGVKLWHAGSLTEVAADAAPSSYPPTTGSARVSADGTKLTFLSSSPLTGYDSNGLNELYRYDAVGNSLLCVSCNPTGARAVGPASVPGAEANGEEVRSYKPRIMNGEGSRIFFDSGDALSPKDSNQESDVYEWRSDGIAGCTRTEGCIGLISSGRGANGASFVDASADGGDVFFLTDESLVAADPGSTDLYDARFGGGFPEPPAPIPCFGDACQELPPEPEDPTPGTGFYSSERNPKLTVEGTRRHGKRHKRHRHHRRHRKHRHHRMSKRGGVR